MHAEFLSWTWKEETTRRSSEDNIKMDPKEIDRDIVDWIHLAQDRNQWRAVGTR
jgi:hypothetical protein